MKHTQMSEILEQGKKEDKLHAFDMLQEIVLKVFILTVSFWLSGSLHVFDAASYQRLLKWVHSRPSQRQRSHCHTDKREVSFVRALACATMARDKASKEIHDE